ncbi:MAG: MFS transporter [Acetobacteraceae bacterium]
MPNRSMARNIFLLATCQAVGQACNTMMFTATALAVSGVLKIPEFATLPVTMQHLGVMLSVFPAAALMQRQGRKLGFRLGSVFGMTGGAVCAIGLVYSSLLIMCLGGLILGYAVANLQMYRFAAVELAEGPLRAKAISWVTAGGVAAGIIGPSLARLTWDQWIPLYSATYAAMIVLHMIVFTVMGFIKFPPPPKRVATNDKSGDARSLWEIASQPNYAVAVIAAMISFGTMSFLMSASPLAIVGCGLPHTEAHWVIFMHVMGMFVPSFFTGNLIQRFGVLNIMLVGAAILFGGIAADLGGLTVWHFRAGLTLNGLGWNFMFVGATTLVSTTYRPSERGKAQALNDFLVFGTTTTCSLLAGILQHVLGWVPLNWLSVILVSISVVAIGWLRVRPQPVTAPAVSPS